MEDPIIKNPRIKFFVDKEKPNRIRFDDHKFGRHINWIDIPQTGVLWKTAEGETEDGESFAIFSSGLWKWIVIGKSDQDIRLTRIKDVEKDEY